MQKYNAADEEELNRRWRPALMAFFLRRARNHAEAEDLTQEVFVRILNSFERQVQPEGFIFQIAANLVADRARRLRVRERYRASFSPDDERGIDYLDPHNIAVARERLRSLVEALEQLPERTRTIFILYRLENLSQEVIGSAYSISASAVKQHVAKAMAFLMKKMEDSK